MKTEIGRSIIYAISEDRYHMLQKIIQTVKTEIGRRSNCVNNEDRHQTSVHL